MHVCMDNRIRYYELDCILCPLRVADPEILQGGWLLISTKSCRAMLGGQLATTDHLLLHCIIL